MGGRSISDQEKRDGRNSIKKAWITSDGCALGIPRISVAKRVTNWANDSSSELSSYTSSVGSRKCYGIGLSCPSETKGDPAVELSLSSSFDLTNSFWTSFICWFINLDCTRSESVESEERVFGSSMLRIEVLVVGVYRPVAFPMGAGRCSGGGCGTLSLGCSGVKGCLAKGGASCGIVGVVCCCSIGCCIS
ncbi:hypothetical protein GW17_00042700 [Ensete ventricosum]|nr:hypothetical protein GW17_00042700 [Ensete ventricosum]